MSRPGPPEIPGLDLVKFLGSGGFAEVYLYRQDKPKREVAVKVLSDAAPAVRFTEEADAMAELGDHPNIAQVFFTGVSVDGRSFLVMPYYPRANFAERVRTERVGVAEVLRVGVRIAGAVQAAHEVGILHRDIKPANVLVDRLGEPRLADFGIAGRAGTGFAADAGVPMSVPWSPPEVLRGEPSTFQSDVYSLGATVWHLLAGRSPFEVPGGDNGVDALVQRIEHTDVRPTGRPDVPAELERVLARAMSPHPGDRYGSAREFAQALRAVEQSGDLPAQTTVLPPPRPRPKPDPVEETRLRSPAEPGAETRFRAPSYVEPAEQTRARPIAPIGPSLVRPLATPPPVPVHFDPPETPWRLEPSVSSPTPTVPEPIITPEPEQPAPRRPWAALVLGGVALVAAAVTGAVLLSGGQPPAPDRSPVDPGVRDQNAGGPEAPPGRPTVTATRLTTETIRFTWTYSAQFDSDTYAWRVVDQSRNGTEPEPHVDLAAAPGTEICVQVKVIRLDGGNATADWSPPGCGR
ncbi:serine/threonine-protein kinase [Actinokineospora enzanensis]|uniref:serine/threonine-protein kinase n=1 Tax=Actinokineospora enzanensis TaxID=155975 RepID=UPI0003651339|nr:serine/threonine-protein kinase [Actinokineospora enzanensis]